VVLPIMETKVGLQPSAKGMEVDISL
jgi:hypothetical protein